MNFTLKTMGNKGVIAAPPYKPDWGLILRFDLDAAGANCVLGTIDEFVPIPSAGHIRFRWCGPLGTLVDAIGAADPGDALALMNHPHMELWRDAPVTVEAALVALREHVNKTDRSTK